MTFEVEEVHPVADKAAIRFHITLASTAAPPCTSGVSRSSPSTDDGLISAVDAYWGEEDVTFA